MIEPDVEMNVGGGSNPRANKKHSFLIEDILRDKTEDGRDKTESAAIRHRMSLCPDSYRPDWNKSVRRETPCSCNWQPHNSGRVCLPVPLPPPLRVPSPKFPCGCFAAVSHCKSSTEFFHHQSPTRNKQSFSPYRVNSLRVPSREEMQASIESKRRLKIAVPEQIISNVDDDDQDSEGIIYILYTCILHSPWPRNVFTFFFNKLPIVLNHNVVTSIDKTSPSVFLHILFSSL